MVLYGGSTIGYLSLKNISVYILSKRFKYGVVNSIQIVMRIWYFIGNASQRSTEPQPETRAVMKLIQEKGFTLSVALDGGSVLVTYPYDKPVQPGLYSLS